MPYEAEVLENAQPGTNIFDGIFVTDKDTVGENLNISCTMSTNALFNGHTSATSGDTYNLVPCSK